MPKGTIRPGVPQGHTTRQTRYRHNAREETWKNSKCKEASWTSRCNAQRGSQIQGTPISSPLDHVCRQLSRTEKEVRTVPRKRRSSISDITAQIEEVVKIFAMEKELRAIKSRGYFPVPQLTPGECKIETIQDKEVLMKEIDEIAVEMLNAIK